MKNILCYGASNTWGFKPNSFNPRTGLAERYSIDERWTGILMKELPECEIIEEGLNGRTTMFDDELANKPMRNGLAYLPFCLESHYPIDLVIFMLGTNDVKIQYNKSPDEIAIGMKRLIECVHKSNKGKNGNPPKVLTIAPQSIRSEGLLPVYFDQESIRKSAALADNYREICVETGSSFLDISQSIKSSTKDGIHLDLSEHLKLALAVKKAINKIQLESELI